MLEYESGYLVVGRDELLYFVEHVWTTWTVRLIHIDDADRLLVLVIQEPWAKVKAEGRCVDEYGRNL